jgi:hypothetical protein
MWCNDVAGGTRRAPSCRFATCRVAYHLAPSYRIIASISPRLRAVCHAHRTVAWYCSDVSARLAGHDYATCPHILQTPRYTWALLDNARCLPFSRYSQILLYLSPTDSYGTRGGIEALPSGEAGSRTLGHVSRPKIPKFGMWLKFTKF